MKYSLKNSVLGAALFTGVVFGVNASAGQVWNNFHLNSGGSWVANFGANDLSGPGSFSNDFPFFLPSQVAHGGSSVISDFDQSFNVTISDFSLWDATKNTLIASGPTGGPVSFFNFGSINPADAGDTFKLHVAGIATQSGAGYAGNLTISPVPEPETYAMLLAGLGLIGFSVRRRVA